MLKQVLRTTVLVLQWERYKKLYVNPHGLLQPLSEKHLFL